MKTPAQWKAWFEGEEFARQTDYQGPLGAAYSPSGTHLRLWAPTAQSVRVDLYRKGDGGACIGSLPLSPWGQGVWGVYLPGDQHGRYYTFTVTVDGVSHPIPSPFIVIATQNPVGAAGTQLLPDSQMDRFMIRLSLGYPEPADEVTMVLNRQEGNPLQSLMPIVTREQLIALQDTVERTFISDTVVSYIVRLVGATRNDAEIARGASPRATLAVAAMSKAVAQLRGRDYVIPGDVREVFARCVEHRLILTPRVQTQGILPGDVLERIVQSVPAPKLR